MPEFTTYAEQLRPVFQVILSVIKTRIKLILRMMDRLILHK